MIRTKTAIFCQRMDADVQHLMQLLRLLEVWNQSVDDIDELMLDAGQDVIERVDNALKDMQSLSSRQWSALYNAQQELADKPKTKKFEVEVLSEVAGPAGDDTDMPEDFAITGCKDGE